MKRRAFIQSSIALTSLGAWPAVMAANPQNKAQVQQYRQLGNTEIKMSDISYGAGKLPSASMVLRALERGINYFDTAPDYGSSELFLGQAIQRGKQRDKMYIASKFCDPVGYEAGVSHLQVGASKAAYKQAVEGSLQRLHTDYLDVVFVHAIGELPDYPREKNRLLDENMLAAVDELKQEGKMRYLAVSSHGPHNMETLLSDAIHSGHFDIVMAAFNFMKFPNLSQVLKLAQEKGVGVIAMKTLAGAKHATLETQEIPFEQAAFKWVLKHPEIAGLVITIKKVSDLDLFLAASGQPFTSADQQLLKQYAALYGTDYCRTGCGDCVSACPQNVPIANILRYQMYFEQYADQKYAMQQYASLPVNAALCSACSQAPCNAACSYGLPVAQKLLSAHETLRFT